MDSLSISLRARLLLLVLLAVIPPFGVISYSAVAERQRDVARAESDAAMLVRLVAREQAGFFAAAERLLIKSVHLPAVRRLRASDECNEAMRELLRLNPSFSNAGVATLDGNIFCSGLPLTGKVNAADRPYFQEAVRRRDFSIGDYQIGRITGKPAINFAYPVFSGDGRLGGVMYAALSLEWLERLLAQVELPAGSVTMAFDRDGTVVAHIPDAAQWVGQSLRDTPLVRTALTSRDSSASVLTGPDGVERLFGYAALSHDGSGNVFIAVGIPKSAAFAGADRSFRRNLLLLAVAAILALVAAWFGSDAMVLRRVNALARAAERLGHGDLGARTGLAHTDADLGLLARRFDDMAGALQRGTRALKTLSAVNRTLARAMSESELLAEMCRVIVEVGGYRLAWIGYADYDSAKTITPMAQAGFDGDTAAFSATVGPVTWADTENGQGPAAQAVRSGKMCLIADTRTDPRSARWQHMNARFGGAANATFPLVVNARVVGVLSIYSQQADAFGPDELELLEEAARDISFGIGALRTRAASDQAQATIEHMAFHDPLTGLPNHAKFDRQLRIELARAQQTRNPFALIVLDVDRLREINDALGFQHGDLLLRDVGKRIRELLEPEILVARMRGDEFAILMTGASAMSATGAVLRVLDSLREPFAVGNLNLGVNAAAGISLYPEHGTDAVLLLRHADVAMQQAKKTGKDYIFYSSEQDANSAQRLALAGELRQAILDGDLQLYYQPKIDIPSGRVCGAEALVRWRHASRGMIAPDDFIPLAEHTGLIKPLTDWVLSAALAQASLWRSAGLSVPVAVNLSARNLQDAELLDRIERLFVEHGAHADWLEIEITEGAVMEDPEGALNILTRLNRMGIKLFIDDFGTGYSSLGYLKKLPVGSIKIDKSFVADMLTSTDSAAIVRSTIDLAHDLDKTVVAEGVESAEMLEYLAEHGCDDAQGYFFSKPLPAEQFHAWLIKNHGSGGVRQRKGA